MRTLIHTDDLKRIFVGAGLAVVAGLSLGASIQPPLQDKIMAPQQELPGGGARTYAQVSEAGIGAYSGQVPEYVIGTNYTRPQVVEEQVLAYQDRVEPVAYSAEDYAQTTETTAPQRWQDEPREPVRYPSQDGNAFNPSDLPPAPEPPTDTLSPADTSAG